MNERFKNMIDALEPDESVVKRIIESEVGLFRQALILICWGLILISFQINIEKYHLALYTTWAGYIILASGLFMLKTENKYMRTSFIISLINLFIRAADYCLSCFPGNYSSGFGNMAYISLMCIISAAQFYALFSGLKDLALRFENDWLAKRLMRCFWLYIAVFIGILFSMLFNWFIFLLIPCGIAVLIYLPVTVNKLRWHVPMGKRVTSVKALNKTAAAVLGLYLLLTTGISLGILYYINAPKPNAFIYEASEGMQELRGILRDMGMNKNIVKDLPDDEILRFAEITDYYENVDIFENDGGKLAVTSCVAILPGEKSRILIHYRWEKNPRHGFTDLLSAAAEVQKDIRLDPAAEITRLSLYDINGTTYMQTPLNENSPAPEYSGENWLNGSSGEVVQIKYRLYNNRDNQRGYAAYNVSLKKPDYSEYYIINFNIFTTYIHQKSLFNRPYTDVRNLAAPYGYNRVSNNLFESFYCVGFGKYQSSALKQGSP